MKWRKFMCVALAATTAFSLAACGGSSSDNESKTKDGNKKSDEKVVTADSLNLEGKDYDEQSNIIYDAVLGEFKKDYDEAVAIVDDDRIDERFAKMAIAEAKLLESGVMCPIQGHGGNYRLSRVAPYGCGTVAWGLEDTKLELVLDLDTKDFMKKDEVEEIRAKWAELKGTGKFRDWEIKYLKDKGYKFKDEYSWSYSSDPTTWDVLSTSLQADSDPIVNTIDPLVGYDFENELTGKLAESWEVSDDGLTYTFHLRKGLKWVDNQQREVGDVTADDFVAGMQHMCDAAGGLQGLIEGVIKNADKYNSGDINDFSEVGVKAVDDTTLEYSLEQPCPYFLSMLGYSVFLPMNREFYESKGGKFGQEYDSSADDYSYGKTPADIAYCGAFVIKSFTEKNSIIYEANKGYWNKKNQTIKKVNWKYTDGTDTTKDYKNAVKGETDGVVLSQEMVKMAKKDGRFDKYAATSAVDGTTFVAFYNLNRALYNNARSDSELVSPKSDDDKDRTKKALLNKHFRLALSYGFDRSTYRAQRAGDDLKDVAIKNGWTGWNLVYTQKDVTVQINGKDVTFEAGTPYGKMVQAQVEADGYPFKVYDETADNGNGSGDGYDGWYNPDEAKKELEQAITELGEQGVEVSQDKPIYIDIATNSAVDYFKNQAYSYKQSIEKALDKKVIVNVNETSDFETWGYSGYYVQYGYEMNYDMFDFSGWGPDYGDPSTFLNTMLPNYSGYMCKCLGIY
jgi:ABC-type oligopeptide transport system substrate-binding subunit